MDPLGFPIKIRFFFVTTFPASKKKTSHFRQRRRRSGGRPFSKHLLRHRRLGCASERLDADAFRVQNTSFLFTKKLEYIWRKGELMIKQKLRANFKYLYHIKYHLANLWGSTGLTSNSRFLHHQTCILTPTHRHETHGTREGSVAITGIHPSDCYHKATTGVF